MKKCRGNDLEFNFSYFSVITKITENFEVLVKFHQIIFCQILALAEITEIREI
jgi:hypothetical protein